MSFKIWKAKPGHFVKSDPPSIRVNPKRITLNENAVKNYVKGRKRLMIFVDEDIPAIGMTFFDPEINGSIRILVNPKCASMRFSASRLFHENPKLLACVAQLGINKFPLKKMLEEDVPEDFRGSDCYIARFVKHQ